MPDTPPILPYYDAEGLSFRAYDVVHGVVGPQRDLAFYLDLAGPAPRRILEIGAGTGRLTWPLAEAGHHVLGIDALPHMLARAEAKGRTRDADVRGRVRLLATDVGDLALDERFDLILAPFFVLNHLLEPAAQHRAVAVMARHLAPDGMACLHCVGETSLRKLPEPGGRVTIHVPSQDVHVTCEIAGNRRLADHPNFETLLRYQLHDRDGLLLAESVDALRYRPVSAADLAAMLTGAGLVVERLLDGFPDNDQPETLVMIGRHAGGEPQ